MADAVMKVGPPPVQSNANAGPFFKPAPVPITPVQRKCAHCEAEEKEVQRKENGPETEAGSGLENYIGGLGASGQPLSNEVRSFYEPRFGRDFSNVRVHTDQVAAKSAQSINALAYTSGNNIVFNNGQYSPGTDSGKRLLGHELTHVVQQGDSIRTKIIQRAENDSSVGCTGLTDTRTDVNAYVNTALAGLRPASAADMISGIRGGIGSDMFTSPGRTEIEGWAVGLPSAKAHQPSAASTKYSGVNYVLWSNPVFPILNPTMKVNGVCIGSDKLGHFFQQGHEYYVESHRSGGSVATAVAGGQRQESGGYGLRTTGVFSNADLEANRKGLDFYNDLAASPGMSFDIATYINANWSEVNNPNFYESSVGQIVWRNLLNGRWTGFFEDPAASVSRQITVTLTVNSSNNVSISGTFVHNAGSGTLTGTITHNTIRPPQASSVTSAISGITINFDWVSGARSGKGIWNNNRENELIGTWGNGTSNSDGGNWNITK
ncbi:MAG: DUF4157 domain-containing protein [Chitinophagaceae bacterium]